MGALCPVVTRRIEGELTVRNHRFALENEKSYRRMQTTRRK